MSTIPPQSLSARARMRLSTIWTQVCTRAAVAWRWTLIVTRITLLWIGEFCHTSPFAAVAPWIGTLVGSWIVGANTGSVPAIIVGAAVAAVGCAPVAAAAQWVKTQGNRTRRQDARERKVLEYASMVLLPKLGKLTHLSTADRVTARNSALIPTIDYLDSVYHGDLLKHSLTTRVVLYAFTTGPDVLDVVHQAGRADRATAFDVRDGGRGTKVLGELYSGVATYASKLVDRNYVSYVSVPIVSENAIYGMISVDTTDVRQLDMEDAAALEVVASALAVFYQESDSV